MSPIDDSLWAFIRNEILPLYDGFDAAHRRDHAERVIADSLRLAEEVSGTNPAIIVAAAAYHDLGLSEGREWHHLVSGRIIRRDVRLHHWFSDEEIELMAQAAEDHRASSKNPPRSVYGRILADADRDLEPDSVFRRTLQFGLSHYPSLQPEAHVERALQHLDEKFGPKGYLRLWIPSGYGRERLSRLWKVMEDRIAMTRTLRTMLDEMLLDGVSHGVV